jgi:hypothetical protein
MIMQRRESDSDEGGGPHWDRKIPVTWLISAIAFVAGQALVMWRNQDSISKDVAAVVKAQDAIAVDVKAIKTDVQVISIESVKTTIKLDELQRRVTALEANQAAAGAKK